MSPSPEVSVSQGEGGGFRWPQAVATGLLWGVVVTVMSTVEGTLPADAGLIVDFVLSLLLGWCLAGIGWSLIALAIDRWRNLPLIVLVWAATSVALGGLQARFLDSPSALNIGRGTSGLLGAGIPFDAAFAYVTWLTAVYGGLYLVAFRTSQAILRTRRDHMLAQLAQREAMARADELRLESLKGQVQPELLMSALQSLRANYASNAPKADRISRLLVDFLRRTMPGLKRPRSTLASEIEVALAYIELHGVLHPEGPAWAVALDGAAPEVSLPSLAILPIVDELSRSTPGLSGLALRGRFAGGDGFSLSIEATGAADLRLPDSVETRVAAGAAGAWGPAVRVSVTTDAERRRFSLSLSSPESPGEPAFPLPQPLNQRR